MIVQSTEGFVESLNQLSRSDAISSKRFLRPLCEVIGGMPDGVPLTSIALSNYQILEERGNSLLAVVGEDKIYGMSFDSFYLAVAVIGQSTQICQVLTIIKKG